MATCLVSDLRIPGGIPEAEVLEYFEQVDATFGPYGGNWLVLGARDEECASVMKEPPGETAHG